MIELFGFELGTIFQGGTLLTALLIAVGLYIRGMPDRTRAKNEGRVIDDADEALKRREWRKEVHDIRNELANVSAELVKCAKSALTANMINEQLMFLMELMISEMEAHEPDSKLIQRARVMFNRINNDLKDPSKSNALNVAELAVKDAKQTLESTKDTCEEVKKSESDK